ncbi:ABC transporter permease [Streptococcus sp. zg-JUN1979]|uniref:ABC transporter permease n=1 Tax=Streptococcus sp. zg-JUN1979 TaxID=3391450 RepID=UPI0039A4AD84
MERLLQERRRRFRAQCAKYMRYVLNDHFVIVLFFLLGFLMVQYSQLLAHLPDNRLPIWLVLIGLMMVLVYLGRVATYLEVADAQFLLAKEEAILRDIAQAKKRAFILWTSIQTVILVLLMPLLLRLGLSVFGGLLLVVLLAVIKWFVLSKKTDTWQVDKRLQWEVVIAYEQRRKQSILKFFSLFTTVKGISSTVKRRAYLDKLLVLAKDGRLWSNLYLRAFLRSGDYLSLYIRLGVLSLLALLFIRERWLAVGVSFLLNYLLVFQLLALYKHYDYQYVTALYPLDKEQKANDLKHFLRLIMYGLVSLECLLSFAFTPMLVLLVATLALVEIYLPYKIKQMID